MCFGIAEDMPALQDVESQALAADLDVSDQSSLEATSPANPALSATTQEETVLTSQNNRYERENLPESVADRNQQGTFILFVH